ncbi:MAG: hypothetical protein AUK55_02290 [Syntrophobacteraceae bacterium CG2_30_61_12]|nr:MAG: hypothetical protein AUK55_02290 [Syntrophobacteraceae bacterium CG2_30_61_12]PIU31373.1 MAG: hypothetical protein COT06_08515 [Syntrophobacteraceae bacterium CG07_land_8_20_14_0_80_61_8]
MQTVHKAALDAGQVAGKSAYHLDLLCHEIRARWDGSSLGLCRRIEGIYRASGFSMHVDRDDQQFYLSALYTLVSQVRADCIVETGTFVGCSAVAMACAQDDQGLAGVIDTIDPAPRQYGGFDVDDPVAVATTVFGAAFPERIRHHRGYSVRPWDRSRHDLPTAPIGVLQHLVRSRRIDLLVIDGDHSYLGAYGDLEIGHQGLRIDGPRLIFVHDYHSISSVRRAVRDWRRRHGDRVAFRAWPERSGFALIQCHPGMLADRPAPESPFTWS